MHANDANLFSPGAQLRAARERRGESVNEVAFALKLNPRQVMALEEDDFDALPGMALVRGFMRNYARHLGIDAKPLLDGVQQMAGRGAVDLSPIRNADGDLPSGAARRRTTRWSGWVVVLLVGVVLGGWYFDWFRTEPVETLSVSPLGASGSSPAAPPSAPAPSSAGLSTLALPARITAIEAPAAPPVPAPVPAAGAEGGESREAAVSEAAAPADAADADADTGEGAAASTEADAAEAGPAGDSPADARPPAPPAGGSQLSFRFNGDSWVEVRDAGGGIVHSGTNRAGTTRIVQGKPPFALIVGNSALVSLEFDGRPINLAAHTKGSVARFTLQ